MKSYATTAKNYRELTWNERDRREWLRDVPVGELQPVPPDESGSWDLVGSVVVNCQILWFWQSERR